MVRLGETDFLQGWGGSVGQDPLQSAVCMDARYLHLLGLLKGSEAKIRIRMLALQPRGFLGWEIFVMKNGPTDSFFAEVNKSITF